MKRIMLCAIVFPMLLLAEVTQPKEEQPWYDLVRQVKYKPTSEAKIDSIRQLCKVKKLVKGQTVTSTLPKGIMGVYSLDWGEFNAGYAVIEDQRDDSHYYVSAKAVTNKFISGLRDGKYRVRDWILSTGDAQGFYPHFFEQHINEGTYVRDRWSLYDHRNQKVFSVQASDDSIKTEKLRPFSNDYMSILLNIRNSKLVVGDTISFPTFVHEKNWNIKCAVLGREKVTVPAGTFNTIKVQPILVGEGQGFNAKDKMYLWFTDDNNRVFVKGKAKARIGHLYAKLYHYEIKK